MSALGLMGLMTHADTPIRPYAHTPFRRFAVSPFRPYAITLAHLKPGCVLFVRWG
jgi:hypothetical protein